MATKKRKTFDPSQKLEVVRMIGEQGPSVQNVSESMDIGQTALRRWLTQYSAEWSGQSGVGKGSTRAGGHTRAAIVVKLVVALVAIKPLF
ncbi:MAG: transposase [Pseudomonadota bacterium]|nr:transposase [Pseudomonadota bacterium]